MGSFEISSRYLLYNIIYAGYFEEEKYTVFNFFIFFCNFIRTRVHFMLWANSDGFLLVLLGVVTLYWWDIFVLSQLSRPITFLTSGIWLQSNIGAVYYSILVFHASCFNDALQKTNIGLCVMFDWSHTKVHWSTYGEF